ncbi:response regulator [Pedosphaera parvula]|uniref:Response regulator receiver protein n=1 Tax=Pedosphaera parvula (strain Ellin514) TaxID=320771 RepID=B9XPC7_PEDPL|nr:response regulator [Pedosphaera parvula]EEF58267.1 response regulator receiver protein [Pedosphaera parvula Ellin514]
MIEANTILLLEHQDNRQSNIKTDLESRLENPVIVIRNVRHLTDYLEGAGEFANRQNNPFPILVLLDLQMPDEQGFSVLEWRRNHRIKEIRRLPFALITQLKDIGTVNRAYALGADTFFARPFNFIDFQNWITHFNWLQMKNRRIVPAVGSGV